MSALGSEDFEKASNKGELSFLRLRYGWKILNVAKKEGHDVPCPYEEKTGLLVDVVLLPVEGGVGLDDDVFVGGLLQLVH
jgi:hypothetical protein